MGDYYILVDGQPVEEPDLFTWARWFESHDQERTVAQTRLGDTLVSTVFLGRDHNFAFDGGPPILYETMIFADTGSSGRFARWRDRYQRRYATRAEAEAGHAVAVALVENGRMPVGDENEGGSDADQ